MKFLDIDCGTCGKNIGKVESYIFQFVDDDLDFVGNDMILCNDCWRDKNESLYMR